MLLVVGQLLGTPTLGLLYGEPHRIGNLVGIHYHHAVEVSRRTSHRLGQRTVRPKEPLLVGVDDCHKRNFRQIQPLAQQVHTDKHIEHTCTQVIKNLDTIQGIDIGMDICRLYLQLLQIVVQLLGHTFGKGGYQHALPFLAPKLYLLKQMVNLMLRRLHLDYRVEQAGGAYNLFNHDPFAFFKLVIGRCGTYINHLLGK